MSKLSDYLNEEIERRGWSKRELARRAGISSAQVTDVLNERANPGVEFCVKVGDALRVAPEKILRMAGLLPPLPGIDGDAAIAETVELMRRLTPEVREEVVAYVVWRYLHLAQVDIDTAHRRASPVENWRL